ncbi:uncharacterized protein LOC128667766 isoform X1 [Microplitis demolitor]|uniref:uncharacterized protein LOC128667766 isoform X1 n=1 Tax=Microplitis demolitor TaxID=69319 RepID=UPI00235B68D5|nr:uncharacterized protein LOC128667766 isoform X1 [Microplitis demolitor]
MSSSDTNDLRYRLVVFVGSKKKQEVIDIVPSAWIYYDNKSKILKCKFMPETMYDEKNLKVLNDMVKRGTEPCHDWPCYPIEIRGRARSYKEAETLIKKLQYEPYAYSTDNEASAKCKAKEDESYYKEKAKETTAEELFASAFIKFDNDIHSFSGDGNLSSENNEESEISRKKSGKSQKQSKKEGNYTKIKTTSSTKRKKKSKRNESCSESSTSDNDIVSSLKFRKLTREGSKEPGNSFSSNDEDDSRNDDFVTDKSFGKHKLPIKMVTKKFSPNKGMRRNYEAKNKKSLETGKGNNSSANNSSISNDDSNETEKSPTNKDEKKTSGLHFTKNKENTPNNDGTGLSVQIKSLSKKSVPTKFFMDEDLLSRVVKKQLIPVIDEQKRLSSQLQSITKMVNDLKGIAIEMQRAYTLNIATGSAVIVEAGDDDAIKLPCTEVTDFDQFNDKLKDDQNYRQNIIRRLIPLINIKQSIVKNVTPMIRFGMARELALKFNLKKANDKRPKIFINTEFYKVLKVVIVNKFSKSENEPLSDSVVNESIASVLNHCGDWEGGRTVRKKAAQDKRNAPQRILEGGETNEENNNKDKGEEN